MNIGDIFGDAISYPFHNIKALVIYIILGLIGALIAGASLMSIFATFTSTGLAFNAFTGLSIIGIIVFILVIFLIEGYALDIVKYGIERRADGPGIDIGRQISNTIKLIVISIVYYIIPVIITFVLGLFLRDWILTILSIIIFIIFALANFMAKCRLAKTDSLGEGLAIGEAIGDISRVGLGKIIVSVILIVVILLVIGLIVSLFSQLNGTLGSIILGIASVYFVFFYNRVIGLLYSDV